MNDWNQWETHLRSWTPRRPSARLKARLFPGADGALALAPSLHSALTWLTPATCALALSLAFWMMRHETPGGAASAGSNLLATISLPNHALGVSATAPAAEPQWNNWPVANLDWTKVALNLSTTGIFSSWRTNIHRL